MTWQVDENNFLLIYGQFVCITPLFSILCLDQDIFLTMT